MKKINLKKHFNWKLYLLVTIGLVIIALGATNAILKAVNAWFGAHELIFNKVINLELKKPVEIREREVATQEIIKIMETIPAPEDLETDNEKYIYEKFKIENYKIALSIAMAESHMNCNAIGINEGSVDLGLFQVNSLWLKNYSLAQLADCKGNIDAAHEIWDNGDRILGNDKGSFNPWVTAKNGAYLKFLE